MPDSSTRASFQEVLEKLKESGCRLTRQREYILETFFEVENGIHLSAHDVFHILRNRPETNVSLATIYRAVKALSQMGILREVDLAEDHKHYELFLGEKSYHHHIICMNCDQTIEFSSSEIETIAQKIAKKFGVEKIFDIELTIRAECKDKTSNYFSRNNNNKERKTALSTSTETNLTLSLPKHRR